MFSIELHQVFVIITSFVAQWLYKYYHLGRSKRADSDTHTIPITTMLILQCARHQVLGSWLQSTMNDIIIIYGILATTIPRRRSIIGSSDQ